jgi:3'-phosphoadenosine 5'-phosphosulfate (PAPS) 3'-phosphatase
VVSLRKVFPILVLLIARVTAALPIEIAHSCFAREMQTALLAARQAGDSILFLRQEAIDRYNQEGRAPDSTKADRVSNQLICEALHWAFPEDGYRSQEGFCSSTAKRYWIVDPLDGTSPFCEGKTTGFCVIIGLVDETGVPVLNVTHLPDYPVVGTSTVYFAVKGCGAYKIEGDGPAERLKVGPKDRMIPFASTQTSQITKIYKALGVQKEDFVKGVSCGLRICSLADPHAPANIYLTSCLPTTCGKKEPNARVSFTSTWDVTGIVVLQEAGGIAELIDPSDSIDWTNPNGMIYPQDGHHNILVATSDPKILDAIRNALSGVSE